MPGEDVLIVEDAPGIQMFFAMLLSQQRIPYRTATNAAQALAQAEADWPQLVLLDVDLPGDIDGWKLWDRLEAMSVGRPLRVVLFTGDHAPAVWAAAHRRGALDVLYKPMSSVKLIRRLRAALQAASEQNNPKR